MSNESEARAALKGIGLLSFGRFSGLFVSLVSMAVLARLLSPHDFGVFAASLLIIGLASALFEGAFAVGVVQRSTVDASYVSSAFWLSMLLALSIIVGICLAADAVAAFLNVPRGGSVIALSSLALLFKAAENVCVAYLRRTSRFAAISLWQFVGSLVGNGLIAVSLAWLGWGAWSLIYGQLVASMITAVGSFIAAKLPLRFTLERGATLDTLRTSGHFVFIHLLNWSALAGSNAVIAHSMGMGPLGLYSRSWKLLDVAIRVAGEPLSSVLLPAFARMQSDRGKARAALERALRLALPSFAILSALAVLHAEAIVTVAFGARWRSATPIVQILFCILGPRCCYKITESVAMGFGRGAATTLRQGIYAVLMIGGALTVAPLGPNWVAVNASCAALLFYLMSLSYAARLVAMPLGTLFRLHAHAVLVGVLVCGVDLFVATLFRPGQFWWGQIASLTAVIAVLGAALLLAPERLLGTDVLQIRRRVTGKLTPQLP